TIDLIKEIEAIVKLEEPYSYISKLPNLVNDFVDRFVRLLEKECKPVRNIIESDWDKVKDELDLCDFKDELYGKFAARFKDLLDRLDSTHNFYEAIAMKEESDRIKMRCFEEIKRIDQKRKKGEKEQSEIGQENGEIYTGKKIINVSVANIFHGAKTIENEDDIESFLEYLREQLREKLKEDTVLKLI
ncbi:MAG: BREX system P-loop protein BrxC, partial [Candidatus Methanofastidiosa archaeon]|nr:BREX system P-loop protein BrxC [Candidatus Methanofastidiosa archaeon]